MTNSVVRLSIPASSGYLVLARTAVAAMCARLDYPIDRLDDAKLATDEACSLILRDAAPGQDVEIELSTTADGHLQIAVSAITNHGRPPKLTSFAWTVLAALAEDVKALADGDGRVTVRLRAARGNSAPTGLVDA